MGGGLPVGRARCNNGSPAASPQTRSHDPLLPLTRTAWGGGGEWRESEGAGLRLQMEEAADGGERW